MKTLIPFFILLSATAFAVDDTKPTGTAAVDDTYLKKSVVKDATTKTKTEDDNLLNSSSGKADRRGLPVQEQQERQEYSEDGYEDIKSDPYVDGDNGNGTTTNRRPDNRDPRE